MDLLAGHAEPQDGDLDSANMRAIKQAFRASMDDGFPAGLELLLSRAHADCEFRLHMATNGVLRGHEAIRAHYREALGDGNEMQLKATSFHEIEDEVIVNGSMRVARAGGGFSERQISWTYRFHDGLVAEAGWGPRRAI